jgi:hypothetical protein
MHSETLLFVQSAPATTQVLVTHDFVSTLIAAPAQKNPAVAITQTAN